MEKELEEKLRDAGERLHHFPSEVDQLLSLLDEVAILLVKVDQSPSQSIQNAYSKLMKVLLAKPLLRHTDVDVQVSVAYCITEITRITAPEAPYEDDEMKEVFQLIVSSFANLSDKSNRSYKKRISILETVAKIRSCVVMLDLECDGLISEMFRHFLSSIRDDHPKIVFESMETIMTLVLEESEDVSVELLMPILDCLRRENQDVPSIARKLGESVFSKCGVNLKPCLKQAVKFSGLSVDGYSKIVTTICNRSNGEVEHDDDNVSEEQVAGERKLTTKFSDGMTTQDAKERVTEESFLKEVPREGQGSVKSVNSNRMKDTGDEKMLNVSDSSKNPDESDLTTKPSDANINKVDNDDGDTGNLVKVDAKQEKNAKRKGRKPCSTKPSEPTHIDSDKEDEIIFRKADKETDGSRGLGKDAHNSLDEDPCASLQEEPPLPLPEVLESEVNLSCLSPNKSLRDESLSKVEVGGSEKRDTLAQELPLVDSAFKKAIDGTSCTEPERHIEQKTLNLDQEDEPSMESAPTEDRDSGNKQQKRSRKKENFVQEHESSENYDVTAAHGGSDLEIEAREFPRNLGKEDEHEPSKDLISPTLSMYRVSPKLSDGNNDSERVSGKEKTNLAQEDVAPVSMKVDDEIDDFEDKPQRRSEKKAVCTKKEISRVTKGNMLKGKEGKGTSKIDTEDNSEEVKELTQSPKEGDGSDSETKPLVRSGKEITSGRRGHSLKKSGGRSLKKSSALDVLETRVSNKRFETTNNEGNISESQIDGDGSGSETKGKEKTSRPVGQPSKKSGKAYVSEGHKEGKLNKDNNFSEENNQRIGHVKNKEVRVFSRSNAKDDGQGMIVSPNSTPKPSKDEDREKNSKRKRTPAEDKLMVSGDIEYGANLIGAKVKVWWPDDKQYYEGVIESFDSKKKKHKVSYTDGDTEVLFLQKEKWEFVDDGTMQEVNEDSNPNSSAKSRSRKKAKLNHERSSNQKQMDVSPRSGAAPTSKSKGTITKCGAKVDSKLKDKYKTIGSSEENMESDDESMDDVLGAASKSKENETKAKSMAETPNTVTKSKGKRPQSGNTSPATGKAKSSLSKLRESSNSKEKSSGLGKTPENAKVKSTDTSKAGKSGKKRRRGF